jgi:tetratricopeptide (TPR) repeat protein
MAESPPRSSPGARPPGCAHLRAWITAAVLITGLWCAPAACWVASAQPRSTTASDFSGISAKADAAREAGQLADAAPLYRKALALRPTWKDGWWALGAILYEQDAHADAARAFRRLLALDSRNGTAHLMLGLCEYQLDRDASAIEHIEAAKRLGVQKDGDLPHVLIYHEGMLLLRAGRYERALETLRPLVAAGVEEESLDLALGMGVLLMRPRDLPAGDLPTGDLPAGDLPTGDAPVRRVVQRAGRAERHAIAKEFDAAKNAYAALAEEAPSVPNVHYAYGRFLLATEDLERGVAEFTKEIARDPGHVRARMQIAAARYRIDSAAGIPFAREVVTLAPSYPFGHYLLGLLYFDTGDITRALPELETAARMAPREAQFQFSLGNAYARAGRQADAARARAAFLRLRGTDDPTASPRLDLDAATRPAPR